MIQAKLDLSNHDYRTTVRLSASGRSRLRELNSTYQGMFDEKVSNTVIFHRALAALQEHLHHLSANHSTQDVAAHERVMIDKA